MKKKIIAYVVSAVMVLTMVPATAFAATDADGSGMSKTAPDTITKYRAEAIDSLENRVDLMDYDTAGAASVQSVIDEYTAQINAAESSTAIASLVTAANTAIDAVETAAEIVDDYYRSGNPYATDGLYKESAYTNRGKEELNELKEDAQKAIEDAKTNEEIDTIIAELKADVDALPLASEEGATSLAEAQAEAIEEINGYLDEHAYPGATFDGKDQADYDNMVAEYIRFVNAYGDAEALKTYMATVRTELGGFISEHKTSTQNTLEEYATEKANPASYGNSADYEVPYKAVYEKLSSLIGTEAEAGGLFARYFMDADDYNALARDGEALSTSDVDNTVKVLQDKIALVPTKADKDTDGGYITYYRNWAAKVEAVTYTDYDTLWTLLDQYKDIFEVAGVTENTVISAAYDTLLYKINEFNKYQVGTVIAEEIAVLQKIVETKGATATADLGNLTIYNYVDALDQRDVIDDAFDDQFTVDGVTAKKTSDVNVIEGTTYEAYRQNLADKVNGETIRGAATEFIKAVKDGSTWVIPDPSTLDDKDFEWIYPDGEPDKTDNVTPMRTAKNAYVDSEGNALIGGQMFEDDRLYYLFGDEEHITLQEAIDAYEADAASLEESDEQIDDAKLLITQLPVVITVANKDAVDNATAAYNALTESQQGQLDKETGSEFFVTLKGKQVELVKAYAEAADDATKAAGITKDADWDKLTAELISLYDTIVEMAEDYGVGVPELTILDGAITAYNGAVANTPVATANAASEVAKIIYDIPNDPDEELTDEDIAAVKKARAEYDALLTDDAKAEFKKAGYLEWLEKYEEAVGIVEADKDLANATVTIVGDFDEGKLPQVARGTTPEVQVTDANGDVIPESAYTVDCNEAHPAGKTALIIRANDGSGYTGENEAAYVVVNNKKSIKSLTGAKKSFTVKYSDYSKHGCTGTQIQWKTSKNGEWKFSKITSSKASKKIAVKKAGKKYVRVRAIVKVDGIRYYSDWSKTKTVTVK